MNQLKAAQELGQSIWLDFIQRNLITSGKLERLMKDGLRGLTSNPTIFYKAIATSDDYDDTLISLVKSSPDANAEALYEHLAIEDIQMAADILRPVYDASGSADGLVSLEISPHLAYDTRGTIAEARRLWQLANRPNIMIKVPSMPAGVPAIETLTAEGININVTLMFSLKHYEAVSQAYIRGIARNRNPKQVASVASFFVSRVDTYADRELEKIGTPEALALRGKAAVANSKIVYQRFRQVFYGQPFAAQRERGARVQRLLWGSTSTKNPAYSDVLYVKGLIGSDTVNTMPLETLDAFRDHGQVHPTLNEGIEEAKQVLARLAKVGVKLEGITEQLQEDGIKAFADSFDQLLAALEKKRNVVVGSKHRPKP